MSGSRNTENGRPIKTGGVKGSTKEVRHDKRIRGDCARQTNEEGCSLPPEWKGDRAGSQRSLFFSREPDWPSETPQIAPVWLYVFVPMRKMNCSIIIFLGAAEQPQTRSKTQTDLKLIRSTVLDILPNHQTQDTVEANVNQADVCPEIFLWFHVSRKESWGSAQMKTFLCNQALLASPQ